MKRVLFYLMAIFFATSMNAQTNVLDDLISFADIIKTNGDFESLVKTHGFKSVEFGSGRFGTVYIFKNCVVKGTDVVPYGKGTSIRISSYTSMVATQYTIEVFNDDAFNQLKTDFLRHAKKDQDGYTFYWSDGCVCRYNKIEKGEKKGGSLEIVVPFTPYEEQE